MSKILVNTLTDSYTTEQIEFRHTVTKETICVFETEVNGKLKIMEVGSNKITSVKITKSEE